VTTLRNLALLSLALTVLFCGLLVLAQTVPDAAIVGHLRDSQASLAHEYGLSPITGALVDTFTDCVAVGNGIGSRPESGWWARAVRGNAIGNCAQLRAWLSDPRPGGFDYFRYWHGYTIVTRPVLAAGSYDLLRAVTAGALVIACAVLLVVVARVLDLRTALCLAAALAYASIDAAAASVMHSFSWIVAAVAGCYAALARPERMWRPELWFVIGATTSYLDMLNNPLVTLTLPLVVALLRAPPAESASGRPLRAVALAAGCWALGYFGLWSVKFVLAWIELGPRALSVIAGTALERLAGDTGHGKPFPGLATLSNLRHLAVPWWRMLASLALCGLLLWRIFRARSVLALFPGALLMAVALLPIAWFEVFANHSTVHNPFTFRILAPTLWLLFLAATAPAASR